MQFISLRSLQNMLHNFEIVCAQFANFSPKPYLTLTLTLTRTPTLILTQAKLCSTFCKLCRLTNCTQHISLLFSQHVTDVFTYMNTCCLCLLIDKWAVIALNHRRPTQTAQMARCRPRTRRLVLKE